MVRATDCTAIPLVLKQKGSTIMAVQHWVVCTLTYDSRTDRVWTFTDQKSAYAKADDLKARGRRVGVAAVVER